MHFIVVDLEATIQRYKDEPVYLTEIGAIKMNSYGELVSRFHSYIKPSNKRYLADVKINNRVTTKKEDLKNAQDIKIVMGKFKKWIYDKDYILVFWSYSDLYLLMKQYINRQFDISWLKNYCDLQLSFTKYIGELQPISLNKAMNMVDHGFIGKNHNALNDAYNTAKILRFLFDKSAKVNFDHNPFERLICHLYKECSKCKKIQYYMDFTMSKGKIKNICSQCSAEKKQMKRERREQRELGLSGT
ncbi:3'-5' exonuclease [Lysinibacillus xylanilyticus]|uniref:Exonuclease domain-containing protein n=1 Tax=Lysinibacillus xylanilyticus TaxID=582475 RepID=A0A2M9Q5P0_9BACI|nr:3'-5' exonuclease [Lysinibacillus xylanilyticus]PJO43399.1 hypothetical protein CWD94_12675 [Lysinibacillus xylanilyticus]